MLGAVFSAAKIWYSIVKKNAFQAFLNKKSAPFGTLFLEVFFPMGLS